MSFSGTQQKCKACDQTVHFAEMMSADGTPYHKGCFRCSNCSARLMLSNYSSIDGILYCKTHFEQIYKETGGISKKPTQSASPNESAKTPNKHSSMFSGTQEKCAVCKKTVYPLEKITVEGDFFHKSCFRCAHAGCFLTTSNYAALDGTLYCKPHFSQLFKQKGCYNHNTNLRKTASMKKKELDDDDDEDEANKHETKSEPDAEIPPEPEDSHKEPESVPAP